MAMDLFESFDPGLGHISLFWGMPLIIFITAHTYRSHTTSPLSSLLTNWALMPRKLKINYLTSMWAYLATLSLFLTTSNWMGMMPFTSSPSCQLIFTGSLSAPLWLSPMLSAGAGPLLAGLTPEAAPLALVPALVGVEAVSTLIRPVTLLFRLSANVVAGHILYGMATTASLFLSMVLSSAEMCILLIQSYIFVTLLYSYTEAH
uniref:ATP synthase subunit a n=1 Tax=Spathoderma clenchi TaxID=1638910 RepID=A0A343YNC4_9MOLL|nr:ATP synthase F0 subunit 6 [Spathoderma clenchi]